MRLFTFFSLLLICACSQNDDAKKDSKCYTFDERQCGGNPWLEDQSAQTTQAKLNALEEYLAEEDIEVRSINLDPDFHEFVCEACFICPQGGRYFVEIDSSDLPLLLAITLLNFEETSCP